MRDLAVLALKVGLVWLVFSALFAFGWAYVSRREKRLRRG
jgi:hypothetical protein